MSDLFEYISERTADFFTACIRYNAEAAVFAAAFHHRYISSWAIDARLGQTVEFFDLWERHINLCFAGNARGINHFWQAVQGLRTKHHVNIRCAFTNRCAFLTGHTATDTDHKVRISDFQLTPAP